MVVGMASFARSGPMRLFPRSNIFCSILFNRFSLYITNAKILFKFTGNVKLEGKYSFIYYIFIINKSNIIEFSLRLHQENLQYTFSFSSILPSTFTVISSTGISFPDAASASFTQFYHSKAAWHFHMGNSYRLYIIIL